MTDGFFPPEEYESCRRSLVCGLGLSEDEANNIISASEQLALAGIASPKPEGLTNKVAVFTALYQLGISLNQIQINIETALKKMAESVNEQMQTFISDLEESGTYDKLKRLNQPENKQKRNEAKLQQAYYRRLK